jgi:hypothetical protein
MKKGDLIPALPRSGAVESDSRCEALIPRAAKRNKPHISPKTKAILSICVRINDRNGPYFKSGKGLRQGDPISALLFNLVVDVFTRMLMKAVDRGYF